MQKSINQKLLIKDTLGIYWSIVCQYKLSFYTMLFCIPVGALIIDALLPYFLSQAIGELTQKDMQQAKHYLIIGGVLGVFGALCNFVGFFSMTRHEANVISHLRLYVFEALLKKDLSFFTNNKVGAMTSRYIDFVRAEVQIQDLFIIRTLGFILSLGGGLLLLALHSMLVACIVFIFVVLLIIQIRWSAKFRANWRHERKELVSEIHGNVADSLTNSLIVKTFANEDREINTLEKLTVRFKKIYRKDIGFIAGEGSLRVALMIVVQVGGIATAIHLVANGKLDLSAAIFILAYLQRIGSQLFVLGEILNNYDNAFLEADPMTHMLKASVNITDKQDAAILDSSQPEVKLNNVSFNYSDSNATVIENIDLTIPFGQKVGLIGYSGAGKTTITRLLLRFHDVTQGSITIGDRDIRDITQHSLRKHISYVPQEPLLFHRTLRENIAYGKPNASDDEVHDATKMAHAHEFIQELAQGYDTLVGERGVKLSGGQRQRVAIARAMLKNAPILVLDEATSALDSESEVLIQDALWKLMQNRTAIVIAHRLSTVQKMDRIIVLDKGAIVEEGSHKELLKQKGVYAKLWSHQSGGFIEE